MPVIVKLDSLYLSFACMSFASADNVTLEESSVRMNGDDPSNTFSKSSEQFLEQGSSGTLPDLLVIAISAPVVYGLR